jgi:catechol 2,3-dioxygenase-like lactoylglutathione lyase family enzyme
MRKTPTLDHIAFNVPDLDALIDRMVQAFGMLVETRTGNFAVVADPASGLKFELGRSGDAGVHFRHLGFRADDVDDAHRDLGEAGMQASQPPHRRDFARMYTSFLKQADGFEIQLVKYD